MTIGMALDIFRLIVVHVHLVNLLTLIELDRGLNLTNYIALFVVAGNFQSDAGEIVTSPEFEFANANLMNLSCMNGLHGAAGAACDHKRAETRGLNRKFSRL